jgi:hypothetical protein
LQVARDLRLLRLLPRLRLLRRLLPDCQRRQHLWRQDVALRIAVVVHCCCPLLLLRVLLLPLAAPAARPALRGGIALRRCCCCWLGRARGLLLRLGLRRVLLRLGSPRPRLPVGLPLLLLHRLLLLHCGLCAR